MTISQMSQQPIPKRTRSSGGIDKQDLKAEAEDTAMEKQKDNEKKDQQYEKMMKSLKKRHQPTPEQKEEDGQKEDSKEKPKKKKKKTKEDQSDQVKDEEETEKPKKQKKKKDKQKQKQKVDDEDDVKQEEQQKSKPKKKKKKLSKPSKEEYDEAKEEEQEVKQKPKKKKKKKKVQQSDEDEEQSLNSSQPDKTKKIKKDDKDGEKKRRGRKPAGPVKRKKFSIFERQQIINKKYRVKKKSHYLNRMSERAWGPMRAGPYRDARKISKEEQKQTIQKLWGDGPGEKKEREKLAEMEQEENQDEDVKIQEEKSQAESNKTKPKSKPKKKKKAKKEESEDSSQEEEDEEESKPKKKKSKKKRDDETTMDRTVASSTKLSKKGDDDTEIKLESEVTKATTKKKKKKKVESNEDDSETEKQAKLQHESDDEEDVTVKPKRKKKAKDTDSQSSSDSEEESGKKKKKDVKREGKKKAKAKPAKEQDKDFSKQQSQKIIQLFAVDGGNYPQMMKQLPGIRLKKVRMHLRMLFHRALDIITYQVQFRVGRKIKQWQQDEKVEIVRELHRIRSSNRLLSESNVQFREKMTALMRSYNDQSELENVSEGDIQFLYKRLEAFVRGYNTINRSKRTTAASITDSKQKEKEQRYKFSKQVTRKPIIFGGHLLSKSVKNQYIEEQPAPSEIQEKTKLIPPEKLVEDWNREEQRTLCELYVNNTEADQIICDELKKKYGPSPKWRDFELLGRKIDQLIKYALIKLQNLTARPYSRQERRSQMQRKRARLKEKLKKEVADPDFMENYYSVKLKSTSMFSYDHDLFQKEQRLQYKHRIFKNLSLLQRQIFGHIQSYKFKIALVKILIEEFPPQEDVEDAVRQAKHFSRWARTEEKKNNISSIKNVFVGEREDREYTQGEEDFTHEDSIMADVDKVEIIKRRVDGKDPSRAGDSVIFSDEERDNKSAVRSKAISRQGNEEKKPITIGLDEEIEVSDFEEPESAELKAKASQIDIENDVNRGEYTMLEKLYEHLNKDK